MKWFFAVLVALNIVVFGSNVALGIIQKQKTIESAPQANIVTPNQSGTSAISLTPQEFASLKEEIAKSMVAASQPLSSTEAIQETQDTSERENKELKKQITTKKEVSTANNTKKIDTAETDSAKSIDKSSSKCTPTVAITMNEDDYHRIKGLLNQWPHAATRTVEEKKNDGRIINSAQTYRILLPINGDAITQMYALSAKGFPNSLYNGQINLGVVSDRSIANKMVTKLANAGFRGAYVSEQGGGESASKTDRGLGISRMKVLFMSVSDKDIGSIRAIVGKYGNLTKGNCN